MQTSEQTDRRIIRFYSVSEAYGELSNFAPYPITLKKKVWPTTEHYFQAQKFVDPRHQHAIRKAKTPAIAARLGRDRKLPLRKDWEARKVSVMKLAVTTKFEQHPELLELLLATQDAKLVEHTANDSYWGDGGDGSGKNMLGQILMDVRKQLSNET